MASPAERPPSLTPSPSNHSNSPAAMSNQSPHPVHQQSFGIVASQQETYTHMTLPPHHSPTQTFEKQTGSKPIILQQQQQQLPSVINQNSHSSSGLQTQQVIQKDGQVNMVQLVQNGQSESTSVSVKPQIAQSIGKLIITLFFCS